MSFHPAESCISRSWRGGGRTKQSWRGGSAFANPRSTDWRTQRILPAPKPLGPIVDSINIKTLLTEEQCPTITGVRYVASYNWLKGQQETILVPGLPPAWTPPPGARCLPPDTSPVYRDINAANWSENPMEPTIRAVQTIKPDFDFDSVDIIGCNHTLIYLLKFAGSTEQTVTPYPADSMAFRFKVEILGAGTVLLVRRDGSPKELIPDLRGYGHTFLDAYTSWDDEVENSCSHQRIIEYDFGGMKILIRAEPDAYLKEGEGTANEGALAASQSPSPSMSAAPSTSLADCLDKLSIDTAKTSQTNPSFPPSSKAPKCLKIVHTPKDPRPVEQSLLIDIKTRSVHADIPLTMDYLMPKVWLSQTSNFVLATHQKGTFQDLLLRDIQTRIQDWETENAALLSRFHAVLRRLVEVVLSNDENHDDGSDKDSEDGEDGENTKDNDHNDKSSPSKPSTKEATSLSKHETSHLQSYEVSWTGELGEPLLISKCPAA